MKTLLSIVGPTASGKTGLSLALAREHDAPIISADSVQIYRGLDIGSGKVTPAEMGAIPHHMIDVVDPCEEFSAGEYERRVDGLLKELFVTHDLVFLVGGAGFYLQAVWEGFDEMPEVQPGIREQLNAELAEKGLLPLVQELREVDLETFQQVDRRNPRRVVRALEIYRSTGTPISVFRTQKPPKEKSYRDLKIGWQWEREALYDRINRRVREMLAQGLEQEARSMYGQFGAECKGLQTVGYREWGAYFKGDIDLAEVQRLIQRNSRHYAKRQLTWFRRYGDIQWFPGGEVDGVRKWLAEELGGH